ncbi:MAG: hypothetical protein ABIP20_02965 [Chthoniobacteraceae bacterium]
MPRTKSNGTKDSSAHLGFEAKLWFFADTALGDSAFLHTGGKLQVMTERRDNLRNNMVAAITGRRDKRRQQSEPSSRAERDRPPKAARRADAEASVNRVVLGLVFRQLIPAPVRAVLRNIRETGFERSIP